jgi:HD-GYP domain-containing protein (c-di-GMP phosphodiesterase class II)
MKINLNEILYAVSFAFDATEAEYYERIRNNGISTIGETSILRADNVRFNYKDHTNVVVTVGHSKRIAVLSILIGKEMGLDDKKLTDLAAYAILHDNALTEVIQEENQYKIYNNGIGYSDEDYNIRCATIGEKNMSLLPFRTNNRDVILLHNENADGSGPFGRHYENTPVKAQIIHLANCVDTHCDLTTVSKDNYEEICNYVKRFSGILFSVDVSLAFLKAFKYKVLNNLQVTNIDSYLRGLIRRHDDEYSHAEVDNLATLLARIVDFKSHYKCRHSIGVAQRAKIMAEYYRFTPDKVTKYYLAGALHDIGKLMVSIDILDKPDRLSDTEFEKMKSHAYYTYSILSGIKGMKDIALWASHHHEKLNGQGYPFHLTAEELSPEERLMTCCDIYQALAEERIYKEAYPHDKIIGIMRSGVEKGEIDGNIVNDLDRVFRNFTL